MAGLTAERVLARPIPGKWSTLEVVAHMVVSVCSPRASVTHGAAPRVDGGVVRPLV